MRKQGMVRIIGGEWRGRKLKVAPVPALRPTPDRVRETLFNWLAPVIVDAYCLDAFAGSGALGFEALSRGASGVVMVDQVNSIVQALQEACVLLKTDKATIYQAVIPEQLKKPEKLFNIVFLDPPYAENQLLRCCFYLEEQGFLAPHAYIYLESPVLLEEKNLPAHWRLLKSKQAGQVAYHLAQKS